mmetsp:Transcript_14732/g.41897  ORF Transcript_14732/g.41897 Transcript_14732/m.41897 type:complete len:257 (+) Transcript_14732:176-946(+)|eukprot:CAMPEP_0119125804 /NCGR_PEP_ID=MMETSP1310-20130426/4952_1 /TAXON_ID=464262 /ORGANISM="Genus nov. species nov., Strain RCC2339" /LENGTH=256 /DNA_ID=CAMNT_0007115911 /DNA_START=141 /DNA_END=911 /DNA_ORIENTATION=+
MEETKKLTPAEYADLFNRRIPRNSVEGVCGRFIRGVRQEDFTFLSDEPGKLLSWICTAELLQPLLGLRPAEAMVRYVGFSLNWMKGRLTDGTDHKLVLFPDSAATLATWENIIAFVEREYPATVFERLRPNLDAVKMADYKRLSQGDAKKRGFLEISELPVAVKYGLGDGQKPHPDFITPSRLLAGDGSVLEARAFFDHTIGCNQHFTGTGRSPTGQREYFTKNRKISDIDGAVVVDLVVTREELLELEAEADRNY